MRNWLTVLTVLIALALPATASAGKRHAERRGDDTPTHSRSHRGEHRGQGFITLYNPNAAPLRVRIDDQRIGRVGPLETVQVGPFDAGQHTVVARYVDRDLGIRERVSRDVVRVDRRHPARVILPVVELAVVHVSNDWIEPMQLVVDAQGMGVVPPGGGITLLAAPGSRLALIGPNGEKPIRQRVRATALATETMALVPPPMADVVVSNPARVPMRLRDASGQVVVRLRPYATETVSLPSGWTALTANFRGRQVDQTKLIANPWMTTGWDIQLPVTAWLTVTNQNRLPVTVSLDGRTLGNVDSGATVVFEGVRTGAAVVTVEASRRHRVFTSRTTVDVDPMLGAEVTPMLAIRDGRDGHRRGRRGHGRSVAVWHR
jgi:hypothetical protein